jgi:hypothetical protein
MWGRRLIRLTWYNPDIRVQSEDGHCQVCSTSEHCHRSDSSTVSMSQTRSSMMTEQMLEKGRPGLGLRFSQGGMRERNGEDGEVLCPDALTWTFLTPLRSMRRMPYGAQYSDEAGLDDLGWYSFGPGGR